MDLRKWFIDVRPDREYRPDLRRFDHAVKVYLRLLGRNEYIEKVIPLVNPDKVRDAELAKGYLVLRDNLFPIDGKPRIGIFFDPTKITSKAVERCPLMPWMYGLRPEDLEEPFERGTRVSETDKDDGRERGRSYYHFSQYIQPSRLLYISNVIIPLFDPGMAEADVRWNDVVATCYGLSHPIAVLANNMSINDNDDEGLILEMRDVFLPGYFFDDGMSNQGLHKDREAALDAYTAELWGPGNEFE